MRRQIVWLLPVLLLAFAAGCGSDDDAAGGSAGTTGTTAAASSEPIVLGAQLDLTGAAQFAGIAGRYGIELALAQINENGGVDGRRIELKTQDSATTPDGGALALRKLVQEDDADIVISMASSTSTLGAVPVAISLGMPFYVSGAGDPTVLKDRSPYVFRGAAASHETTSNVFVDLLGDHFQARTVGLMIESSNPGYVKLADLLAEKLPEAGIEVIEEQRFQVTDRDFTAQIAAFRDADPDVILSAGYPQAAALFLRQARRSGLDTPMTGETSQAVPDTIRLAGDEAAEGYTVLWGAPQWIGDETGAMGEFRRAFFEEFPDAKPEFFNFLALWSYADTFVIAEALKRSGGDTEPDALVEALESISDFQAGAGDDWPFAYAVGQPRSFAPDQREGTQTLTPLIIRDGEFQVLEGDGDQ